MLPCGEGSWVKSDMASYRSTGIPLEAQYLYRQALQIKNNGKKEDALKYLQMAVSIAPLFCNAYNAMGNCLDEMGRYDEAMRKYEKVLEINPQHTEARFKQAMIQKKIRYGEEVYPVQGVIRAVMQHLKVFSLFSGATRPFYRNASTFTGENLKNPGAVTRSNTACGP